jgi:DNA-binding winged helix-turn-helix (wHTH) protein
LVSTDQLMNLVWPDAFVEENNLAQNVFLLRRTFGQTPEGSKYTQTVSKLGYRINVPVQEAFLDPDLPSPTNQITVTVEKEVPAIVRYAPHRLRIAVAATPLGAGYLLGGDVLHPAISPFQTLSG